MLRLLQIRRITPARVIPGSCLFHTSRFALAKVPNKNRKILDLAPQRGRATIITEDGKRLENVSIFRFLKNISFDSTKQDLVVVSMQPVEGRDPNLVCKVVAATTTASSSEEAKQRYKDRKAGAKKSTTPSGPQKEKTVPVSWTIGASDLKGQKRNAIQSVIRRGHKAIVTLESKSRRNVKDSLTELELERRQKIVDDITEICEELGRPYAKPSGTIHGQYCMYYTQPPPQE